METLNLFFDFFINLEKYIFIVVNSYHQWVYFIFFLIIFAETGFVFTPFLPGDSLLFVLGTIAGTGQLDLMTLMFLLFIAAIAGDFVNYSIGKYLGPKVFRIKRSFFFNPDHLKKTNSFFIKHGGKTIFLARFVPIIRTYAPFVAGIAKMNYKKFIFYNVFGGGVWIFSFLLLGFYFGNIPTVKENLSLFILLIIFMSLTPGIFIFTKEKIFTKY